MNQKRNSTGRHLHLPFLIFYSILIPTQCFYIPQGITTTTTPKAPSLSTFHQNPFPSISQHHPITTTTSLPQSSSNDNEGPNALTATILIGIILLFIITGIGPLLDAPGTTSDLNIGDSVPTRQDSSKVVNYQSDFDKLSRSKIQEKLNRVPVFFLEGGDEMVVGEGRIYLSFEDAKEAAAASGNGVVVKCTTLDQVMYPLVLKRGRMKMAPPPSSIQKAEAQLTSKDDDASPRNTVYKLVPSKAALQDARDEMLPLKDGDVPLFVAERLAFAGQNGPQVPLFLEKADCLTSYARLKESSRTLPETPKIRTTTLRDVLDSMEKGTRPAVSQLQFYATADDLVRASEMM